MKKFLTVLAIVLLGFCNSSFAEEQTTTILTGVEFSWVNMTQVERDEAISLYRKEIFGTDDLVSVKRKTFRNSYKDVLKDSNYKANYRLISNGATESKDARLCGFFYKDDILYMYAIQPNKNPKNIFYYTAFGRLAYVDTLSDNYPNFPYHSKQYRANGKLAGAIYFISKDLQYVYTPNGEFKGVWYKDKMFDEKGKQILTRNNW